MPVGAGKEYDCAAMPMRMVVSRTMQSPVTQVCWSKYRPSMRRLPACCGLKPRASLAL